MRDWHKIHNVLIVALIALLSVTLLLGMSSTKKLQPIPVEPQVVTLTTIAVDCDQCFDISQVNEAIKKQNPSVEEKTVLAKDAQDLIEQYGITKLPAVIIQGLPVKDAQQTGNASIVESMPPYVDVATMKVKGLVNAVILDTTCKECTNMNDLVDQLKSAGIVFSEVRHADEAEKAKLIQTHNITRLPSIILDEQAKEYEFISQVWSEVGVVDNGNYVLKKVPPPFVEDGMVKGLVTLTLLEDKTCVECYNVSLHQSLLSQNFGMAFKDVEHVDVSSARGKKLVQKYNIVLVPTYILDKEAQNYELLTQLWDQVGTIEDGNFVFREVSQLGTTYKSLANGTIIRQ